MNRVRRSILYMPGDDRRKIEKARSLDLDSFCMDLEDGVALNNKPAARESVVSALQELDFGHIERLVRINPAETALAMQDLESILVARPDGIVVPKVETAADIRWVAAQLDDADMPIIAIVETARGIVNLKEIGAAGSPLSALAFGAEDLAGDIGATRTKAGMEVLYARSAVITHAAANDLQALDMVFVDFRDLEGLAEEAQAGASMGYDGKQAIHPNQIQVIHQAFTPNQEEIEQAQRIVVEFDKNSKAGTGAFAIDGKMIDMPLYRAAQNKLAKARAAGLID